MVPCVQVSRVVPAGKLRQLAIRVRLAYVLVDFELPVLEQRPERLNAVGVHAIKPVFAIGVAPLFVLESV